MRGKHNLDFIKLKKTLNFYFVKKSVKRIKGYTTKWEKRLINHISDK